MSFSFGSWEDILEVILRESKNGDKLPTSVYHSLRYVSKALRRESYTWDDIFILMLRQKVFSGDLAVRCVSKRIWRESYDMQFFQKKFDFNEGESRNRLANVLLYDFDDEDWDARSSVLDFSCASDMKWCERDYDKPTMRSYDVIVADWLEVPHLRKLFRKDWQSLIEAGCDVLNFQHDGKDHLRMPVLNSLLKYFHPDQLDDLFSMCIDNWYLSTRGVVNFDRQKNPPVWDGFFGCVSLLFEKGLNPQCRTNIGFLMEMFCHGNRNGAYDPNGTNFRMRYSDLLGLLDIFVEHGVKPDNCYEFSCIVYPANFGNALPAIHNVRTTFLHAAVCYDFWNVDTDEWLTQVIDPLLQKYQVPVNVVDSRGNSVLHTLALFVPLHEKDREFNGHLSPAWRESDLVPEPDGECRIKRQYETVIHHLISRGADFRIKNSNGETALDLCKYSFMGEVVSKLGEK